MDAEPAWRSTTLRSWPRGAHRRSTCSTPPLVRLWFAAVLCVAASISSGSALSLVSVPLMTRYLGAVDYGRVLAVFALIAVAGAVTDGGLTTVGVREYSVRPSGEHRAVLRAILGLRMVLTLAGIAGAWLFATAVGYPAVLVGGTLLAGAGLFAGNVQKVLTVPLAASLRLGTMASLNLFEQVALLAFVLLLVIGDAGLLPFFTIYLVSGLAALVATVAVVGRTPSPAFDLSTWRMLWRDMLPYGAATAISAMGVVLIAMPLLGYGSGRRLFRHRGPGDHRTSRRMGRDRAHRRCPCSLAPPEMTTIACDTFSGARFTPRSSSVRA